MYILHINLHIQTHIISCVVTFWGNLTWIPPLDLSPPGAFGGPSVGCEAVRLWSSSYGWIPQ